MIFIQTYLFASFLLAAPAPPHSKCSIIAEVKSIQEREVKRESLGLEREMTYIDIDLNLKEIRTVKDELDGECTLEYFKDKTFQLRPGKDPSALREGECIEAKTQFTGDEFLAGQWIWDIQQCS